MIESSVDDSRMVTTHICRGAISITEIAETISEFYRRGPTPHVLWDLAAADISGISADQSQRLADSVPAMQHSRERGRTAIVASHDLAYGLSRMYRVFADFAEHQGEIRVFRVAEEARRWLTAGEPAGTNQAAG